MPDLLISGINIFFHFFTKRQSIYIPHQIFINKISLVNIFGLVFKTCL